MSRLDEQIDRDLGVIAERVTPSPDAWAEIQQRIADRQPEQDTEIIMLTENTLTRRRWPLVAAAAAVAALAIGAIALVNRDDGTEQPADVPEPTPTIDLAPEPEAETADVEFGSGATPADLPFAGRGDGSSVDPGRYTTDLLGVDVAFDVPRDLYVVDARPGTVVLLGLLQGELGVDEYTLDNGVFLSMSRVAGWSTPEESLSPNNVGSIEPYDIDSWIDSNGLVVSLDEATEVDGREARVVQVRVSQDSESAPGCETAWEPCVYTDAIAADLNGVRDWALGANRSDRRYLVTIEGSEPLLIVAGGGDGSVWFDEFEDELMADIELGPDAPPLGYTAPASIIGARAPDSTETGDAPGDDTAGETEQAATDDDAGASTVDDATALLDGWVDAWNSGDEAAVADLFVPDAVLITPDGRERVGQAAGDYMASFVPMFTRLSRTSDGVDAGSGAYSFDVEWKSEFQTDERVLVITEVEGQLRVMDEQLP